VIDIQLERKVLFQAVVGSHNYNLNTPESDIDYKIFVCPTFDDLYHNNQFSASKLTDAADYDVHDIRKLDSLWWKSNINFIEVLYSQKVKINEELSEPTKRILQGIFNLKSEIVTMNLPYLYDACVGMHHNKMKLIDKGTEGTQHLVDKFGIDTKQCLHAYRVLDFLRRFADTDFRDFQKAIWHEDDSVKKWLFLKIKNGEISREDFVYMSALLLEEIKECYKDIYKSQQPNEKLRSDLVGAIKDIVLLELDVFK
jgi:predicted nucleotidyltransferase